MVSSSSVAWNACHTETALTLVCNVEVGAFFQVAPHGSNHLHMQLRPETQQVLEDVERVSGKPVTLDENPDLPQIATMPRARGAAPAHVLTVNPRYGAPDYFILYQCGFVLRYFAVPEAERKDFAGTKESREEVARLVRRNGRTAGLPDQLQQQLAIQLVDGLLTQLRSYPVGMRIDTWIAAEYPQLSDLQREGIARQQEDNRKVLSPEIRGLAPKPVYDANVTMNAAYATFSDRLFGKAGYAIPYRSAGYEKPGRRLLEALQQIPADVAHDVALVDAWAEELDLRDWYRWLPAQP